MKNFLPWLRVDQWRPEVVLALRISLSVLSCLLFFLAIFLWFGSERNENRIHGYFSHKEEMFFSEKGRGALGGLSDFFSTSTPAEIENRFFERRFIPPHLKNLLIVFENGKVLASGPLDRLAESGRLSFGLPTRKVALASWDDETYLTYSFPVGNRRIVFYESDDMLKSPFDMLFFPLVAIVLAFSVALFFISFSFAKSVIRPLQELAEREKSFARHVAHELKTPLAVAKGDLELSLLEAKGRKDRIASALEEVSSLKSVVDSLLALSVPASKTLKKKRDVVSLIEDTIETTGSANRFRFVSDVGFLEINAEPGLLDILLRNLFSNSIVHSNHEFIDVSLAEGVLRIANVFDPLKEPDFARAFLPFVGTPGKGSWIGLSLVKKIADEHGWTVSLRREGLLAVAELRFGKSERLDS